MRNWRLNFRKLLICVDAGISRSVSNRSEVSHFRQAYPGASSLQRFYCGVSESPVRELTFEGLRNRIITFQEFACRGSTDLAKDL
jgi:hypothetical protein